ncbi:hypothetical protein C2845_PM12G22730 [Panicum miliaceum]|uniref:Uncharacterized protein n=1 Tax=Panicum miliaceum TaxID=4540 RepID=A0A3L6QM70_PANMI|nr:hypothetical protein C2845_PM12G22730 [Panicum miliaceum]
MQSHTVSDHEVVFLNERTARKRSSSAENPCAACARPLTSGHDYCSPLLQGTCPVYVPHAAYEYRLTRRRLAWIGCAQVKHLGESEHGLRRALRARRQEEAAAPEPQGGKRRPSPASDAGPSCVNCYASRNAMLTPSDIQEKPA